MNDRDGQHRTTVIIQVVVLALICIGLVVLAFVFGVFNPPKGYRNLTMRIESTAGSATLTYSVPGDENSDSQTVSTPWEKSLVVKVGSEVFLFAGNPNQIGTMTCFLLLDGKTWKKQSVKYPVDKVSCAGIIP